MGSFYFKKFTVKQERSAMKVNTDGVLLGAWVGISSLPSENPVSVADIGTGTGVISLILAQRISESGRAFKISAIDIDSDSGAEASENFSDSEWRGSLFSHIVDAREFSVASKLNGEKFDLVISNPPYFINSLKPDCDRRLLSRHSDNSLSPSNLAMVADNMLSESGLFAVILPVEEEGLLFNQMSIQGFYCKRRCFVKTTPDKQPKRVMSEYIRAGGLSKKGRSDCEDEELIIQEKSGEFTAAYKSLTKSLYLRF